LDAILGFFKGGLDLTVRPALPSLFAVSDWKSFTVMPKACIFLKISSRVALKSFALMSLACY